MWVMMCSFLCNNGLNVAAIVERKTDTGKLAWSFAFFNWFEIRVFNAETSG